MTTETNECCDCKVPAYPCLGDDCPNRHAIHYKCDRCGAEDKLYIVDGEELCADCTLELFDVVKGSE